MKALASHELPKDFLVNTLTTYYACYNILTPTHTQLARMGTHTGKLGSYLVRVFLKDYSG